MELDTLGRLVTFCVFGGVGLLIARRRTRPVGAGTWVLLGAAAVVGSVIGTGSRLVSVFGFEMLLSWAIVSCCLGIAAGLLLRRRALQRRETA